MVVKALQAKLTGRIVKWLKNPPPTMQFLGLWSLKQKPPSRISNLQPLFSGPVCKPVIPWPDPSRSRLSRVTDHGSPVMSLSALCFHNVTNRFSRKPFVFTSIRIARGCGVPDRFSQYVAAGFSFILSLEGPGAPLSTLQKETAIGRKRGWRDRPRFSPVTGHGSPVTHSIYKA